MKKNLWLMGITLLAATGCVNPQVSTVRDTKVLPTYAAPRPAPQAEIPRRDPDAYRSTDPGRTYSLTLKNADIKDVLMLLSKESGVPIVAERSLRGSVKIEAQNKKLGELLYAILKPLGYTASVENGIIMVGRPQLSTRTFRVNYIKDKRNSASNMNVSGFAAGGSSGSVSVSTEGKSDFWGALESSLEMLVFGTSGQGKREGGGYIRGEAEKKSDGKTSAAALSGSADKTAQPQAAEQDDPFLSSTQISEGRLKQLVVNEMAGIVQVTDYPENLDKIAAFLADVEEGSKRQVMIQAHIMEVSLKDSYALGIDWKYILDKATNLTFAQSLVPATSGAAAAGSNVFKLSASGSDFSVLLDAMKEQGNVNMLSSPKITALNNQKAVIKLTTKQVSWISSKTTQNNAIGGQDTFTTTPQVDEVGIFLDVTPQIGPDSTITMQIHPSVSEIKEISTSPDKTSTKPVIDIREIDTMVDARAGETIVIAGLISDKLAETKRSVPLLGDIPYLGALFSYNKQERAKAELVIMMTPYVLNPRSIEEIRSEHEKRIRNLGGTFHLINNLGSLVTEENSREWIKRNQPTPPFTEPQPAAPAEKSSVVPAVRVKQTPPRPVIVETIPPAEPAPAAPAVRMAPSPPPMTQRDVAIPPQPAAVTLTEHAAPKLQPLNASPAVQAAPTPKPVTAPRPQKPRGPALQAVTATADGIRIDLADMKDKPVVLRETKNRRLIIQLPGAVSTFGDATLTLNTLGFERARVARHNDGTWVVLHASAAEFPRVESRFDSQGLTIVAAAPPPPPPPEPVAALPEPRFVPAVTSADQPPARVAAPEKAPLQRLAAPAQPASAPESPRITEFRPQLASRAADSEEQSLYRSGVAAYKAGNCSDAIRLLSRFIAAYPDSYFAQDAAIYRSDCQER